MTFNTSGPPPLDPQDVVSNVWSILSLNFNLSVSVVVVSANDFFQPLERRAFSLAETSNRRNVVLLSSKYFTSFNPKSSVDPYNGLSYYEYYKDDFELLNYLKKYPL